MGKQVAYGQSLLVDMAKDAPKNAGGMAVKAVEIRAELRQIRSMADHTYNVILNVPEDCLEQVKVLMGWLGDEVGLVIASGDLDSEVIVDGRTRRTREAKKG